MKKSLFFAPVAAIFALASCQVDIIPVEEIAVSPVFTAEIVTTRTTVDIISSDQAKVSWVLNDEVEITDGASNHATYYVSAIDETGKATLTIKDGETALGVGPYTAVYGSVPSTTQTYNGKIPSLPMSAEKADSENTLYFKVTCGVLEVALTKPGESIKSIAVSDGSTTYTLTCNPTVSIATGHTFYIALPAANYTSFTFTNASDKSCTKTIKAGNKFEIENNTIRPISFTTSLVFEGSKTYPEGTLSGVFSVAADKKIRFSRGNLQYQASAGGTWRFAEHQYDFIGDAEGNTTAADKRATQTAWIDLFGWGTTGVNSKAKAPYWSSTDYNDYSSLDGQNLTIENNGDWGVCMPGDWHLITSTEWTYLVNHHTYKRIEVTTSPSFYGFLFMPDGWSGSLAATMDLVTLASYESIGGVFLPCAGRRNSVNLEYTDQGYYWCSQASGNTGDVWILKNNGEAKTATNERRIGTSVRLVIDN